MADDKNQIPNQADPKPDGASLRLQYMPTDPSFGSMAYFHEGSAEVVAFLGNKAQEPESWIKMLNLSSIGFTMASGVAFMNPVRILGSLSGYIGMGCYLLFPLTHGPLKGDTIVEQFPKNLLRPDNNRDFSRYSWAFITSALTLLSGIFSGRAEEVTRGAIRLGATSAQLKGLHDKDQELKAIAAEEPKEALPVAPVIMESSESKPVAVVEHNGRSWNPFKGLKRSEVVGFSLSMLTAAISVVEGVRHDDKNMLMAGVTWLLGLGSEMIYRSYKYQKKVDELKNAKEPPAR